MISKKEWWLLSIGLDNNIVIQPSLSSTTKFGFKKIKNNPIKKYDFQSKNDLYIYIYIYILIFVRMSKKSKKRMVPFTGYRW